MNTIQICNVALALVGNDRGIQSLDEPEPAARYCKIFFESTRESLLRAFPWGFATRRVILGQLATAQEGWEYAYQYPADCLHLRKLVSEEDTPYTRHEFEIRTDGSRRIICANLLRAAAVYTADITDANLFDPLFVDAMSYRLGARLALSLQGDPYKKQLLEKEADGILSRAVLMDAQEGYDKPEDEGRYLNARG